MAKRAATAWLLAMFFALMLEVNYSPLEYFILLFIVGPWFFLVSNCFGLLRLIAYFWSLHSGLVGVQSWLQFAMSTILPLQKFCNRDVLALNPWRL